MIGNNSWYRAYKDRFNIQVENLWVSNDYNTKLNLAIASGELPDVFRVTGQQLVQLYEADAIMDITDVFDNYASDRLKEYMQNDVATFDTAKFDDKLFAIPQLSYGIIDQFDYFWIRKDWKDQLGFDDPKTMNDVVAMAQAFTEEFGGYPIAENQSLDSMKRLAIAWDAHPGIWIENEDSSIEYGSVQPQMKEVLATFATWYDEGIINPDFAIYDQEKMFQDLINGKTGVVPFAQWLGYYPGPDIIKIWDRRRFSNHTRY